MLKTIQEITHFSLKTNHYHTKKELIIICDNERYKNENCLYEYSKHFSTLLKNQKLHFCSQKCANIYTSNQEETKLKKKDNFFKNHGVTSTRKLEKTKQSIKKTKLKNHNDENYINTNQIKRTKKERYNDENYVNSEKAKKTKKERYGDESYNNIEQNKQTCRDKYNVDNVFKLKETHIKSRQKKKELYSDENYNNREQAEKTYRKLFRTKCPLNAPQIRATFDYKQMQKTRHETMKRNKTYKQSMPEELLYKILCKIFKYNNVIHHKEINGWNIDFYIENINTYIQLDGIYWHGLDRPVKVIKEFRTSRDKIIYGTYLRDIEQNKWFKENNLKLIRVIDKELIECSFDIHKIKELINI